ncbi:MAG TPA: hypothetical protein VFR78_12470 [Pyrinomonadaceae bacterium]|nr:hypothetical protein [Pyrinomonadaceae bacterium]
MNQLTEEQRKQPERIWRTTNGYIYKGPTPEPCVEYVRADLLTTACQEARAKAFKDAITETCLDCAEGDPPTFDAKARWYYHGEGREQVGCSASKLRMIEAAATTQKDECRQPSQADGT